MENNVEYMIDQVEHMEDWLFPFFSHFYTTICYVTHRFHCVFMLNLFKKYGQNWLNTSRTIIEAVELL